MTLDMKNQAAIVGIGVTDLVELSPKSTIGLAAEAMKAALADAGAGIGEVDGIAVHTGVPMGVDYDHIVPALGMNLRYVAQYWTHGRWVTQNLQNAAFAVATGMADMVACVLALDLEQMRPFFGGLSDAEGSREAGGPHGQAPAFGLTQPHVGAALSAQRYFAKYGLGEPDLLPVVASMRAHAALNPHALRGAGGFDPQTYIDEPLILDPLRLSDCALPTDIGVVLLVTSAERAARYAKKPVFLRGMQGMRSGRQEFLFGARDLGVWQQDESGDPPEPHRDQVFDMAGVTREQIDALYTYDAYSPLVYYVLERFGYCAPGTAPRFVRDGHTLPGGKLPLNTSGGMLGEGYACGWHSLVEIVRQLRGEAGPRQIAAAKYLQWGTNWGDSIIFGNEP